MKKEFKQFKIYAPPSSKQYSLNDDGTLTITGVFSTTNKDLDGDIVSPRALESLKNQAVGLNLHLDHNHNYDGGIGAIIDSFIKDSQVYITAKILKEHAQGILERLELGMNFGFSVGGIPVVNNLNPQIIDDFVLLEISLTLLPANWDTFGTVEAKGIVKSKCLTGACHYIIKNSTNIMKKEFENIDSNELQEMIINYVNEAFANKEQVIIDEFRNELQPIVAEIVAEEVTPKVQEIVVSYLDELFPPVEEEEEFVEADVDEETVEETEIAEEEVEEKAEDEEVIEEKETDDENIEEKEAEEEAIEEKDEEVTDEEVIDEIFDEPLEIDIEKEAPAEETTTSEEEVETEEVEEVAETASEEAETKEASEEEPVVLDEKAIEAIVKRVLERQAKKAKKLKKAKTAKKVSKKPSKLKAYKKSNKKEKKSKSFLNSEKRDRFGRNRKYL